MQVLVAKLRKLCDSAVDTQSENRIECKMAVKVIYFGSLERDYILPYNTFGFRGLEDIVTKITENCRCRPPHCRLKPSDQKTP